MKAAIQGRSELLRQLPSVDELLRSSELRPELAREGPVALAAAARSVLARLREEISSGHLLPNGIPLAVQGLAAAVQREAQQATQFSLRPVINATGVVLHTNLGRAPLGQATFDRIFQIATAYSNLEFDVQTGERGQRDLHTSRLFSKLFAESLGEAASQLSSIIVNNNAAAVLLALNTFAESGEAIVSRGELVEIGGNFRIPEVMSKAGVALREVGATNRTRISDYARAVTEKTRVLLRVHRSNFSMVGFTAQPALAELVALGRKHGIPVIEDLGSGAFFDLQSLGIRNEPTVVQSLRAGVDLVTYSGDKLLGGPQAGILTGSSELTVRLRRNPLFRALRVDKLTYAALEATLVAYVRHDSAAIPSLQIMQTSAAGIQQRAQSIAEQLRPRARLKIEVVAGESVIGGGAAPGATLPTFLLAITAQDLSAEGLAGKLRAAAPMPIIARVEAGAVLLDLRTVFPQQDALIAQALTAISV